MGVEKAVDLIPAGLECPLPLPAAEAALRCPRGERGTAVASSWVWV